MSDQNIREVKGHITISRYAKKETRRKSWRKIDEFNPNFETRWYLWITRLYSGVRYFEGEYKIEKRNSEEKFFYGLEKTMHPIHASSFDKKLVSKAIFSWKFYIAVKELIIEWEDYQAEIAGYVHCEACEDLIDQSEWFNNADRNSEYKYENLNDAKQLLRFVKSPGLKTTNIKIQKADLEFFPIDLKRCKVERITEEEMVANKSLQVRREHHLDCEIRPLFDGTQPLPIKYAHITVEIHLQ